VEGGEGGGEGSREGSIGSAYGNQADLALEVGGTEEEWHLGPSQRGRMSRCPEKKRANQGDSGDSSEMKRWEQ